MVFTYVFSTVGVCVIAHYCGGELEKVSLFSKPSSCCDGEDDQTDDCCKNDEKHVQLQQDFTFTQVVSDCKAPCLDLFIVTPNAIQISSVDVSSYNFMSQHKIQPSHLVQQDLVSHSVIRI